ncbi:MAG: ArsR family transcriptional regulator [Thermodesulfobacteriota bacterium]
MRKEARFFKSLSDETRLKILWLLSGAEALCVCDVMEKIFV